MKLDELVGKGLESFTVKRMIEVYATDAEGKGRTHAIACFTQPDVAEAFAGLHDGGSAFNKTREVLVLTDGNVAFRVDWPESVLVRNDDEEALRLKEEILKKLTPVERKILGH